MKQRLMYTHYQVNTGMQTVSLFKWFQSFFLSFYRSHTHHNQPLYLPDWENAWHKLSHLPAEPLQSLASTLASRAAVLS